MSYNENFDSDLGGYSAGATTASWDGTLGYFSPGCAKLPAAFVKPNISKSDTHTVVSGDKLYCYYRILGCADIPDAVVILQIIMSFNLGAAILPTITGAQVNSDDTGWVLFEQSIPGGYIGDTLDYLEFNNYISTPTYGSAGRFIYIDTVVVGTSPPSIPGNVIHSSGGIPGLIKVSS